MRKYPYRLDTIGKLLDDGFELTAWCHRWVDGTVCRHHVKLDLEALCQRLGRNHGCMHWDIAPLLRCSKCGARGVAKGGPISIQLGIPMKRGEETRPW